MQAPTGTGAIKGGIASVAGKHHKHRDAKRNNSEAQQIYQMGNALVAQGRISQAVIYYERALSIRADFVEASGNLGNALAALGNFDQAIICYEHALSIKADPQIHFNLATVLGEQGKIDQAISQYEHALSIKSDFAEAHNNLGTITSHGRGQIQAIAHFQRAIELKPEFCEAHNNLALALQELGDIQLAITHFSHALSIKPDFVEAHNNLLLALNYTSDLEPVDVRAAHLAFAKQWEAPLATTVHKYGNNCSPDERLRIGYVSSDFRRHSVSHFIEPVLEYHNRNRFEIFCYENNQPVEGMAASQASWADHWCNIVHLSDDAVVQQIRMDKIDILVDLNGHTAGNRLLVFARKPAPIQVTWLGYPNTTGLSAMDYRLTDTLADPLGMTDSFHTEKLIRMPDSFSVYKPSTYTPEVSVLPAQRNGYITFGSFNKLAKATPEVIMVWARLLLAIPGSHLFLKTGTLAEEAMQHRLLKAFADLGVASDRLELRGHDHSQCAHLEQYSKVDIGLDPFPYNGTTTSCEALWMGVPVLTLAGRTHVGRVGISQMTNLGLTEFVCHTRDEYIAGAVRLSADLKYLETLRKELRPRMAASPLMDAQNFTNHLEQAYLGMWENWCLKERASGLN
ncbi:MAG: tetratricopeptide repeat protein [Thiobacillaceae bacterium]